MSAVLWFLLQGAQGGSEIPDVSLLHATVVAGPQVNLTWAASNVLSEAGYKVWRRDRTAGGAYAVVHTTGANTYAWAGDAGPFVEDHAYQYYVEVLGGPSDGQTSNVVTVFRRAVAGTHIALGMQLGL